MGLHARDQGMNNANETFLLASSLRSVPSLSLFLICKYVFCRRGHIRGTYNLSPKTLGAKRAP